MQWFNFCLQLIYFWFVLKQLKLDRTNEDSHLQNTTWPLSEKKKNEEEESKIFYYFINNYI